MTPRYEAGAVWWVRVDFRDGQGERTKYFVLLNDAVGDGDSLIGAVTTSQGTQRYGAAATTQSPCGCPSASCFRISIGQETCFGQPTWVQFDNIMTPTRGDLEGWQSNSKAGFIQMLTPDRVRAVMNCATKSEDLAGRHITKIKDMLKAKNAASKGKNNPAKVPAKGPFDVVLEKLAAHGASCRQGFYELAQISEAELSQIKSQTEAKESKLKLEDAIAAMDAVSESCTCNAPKKTL